MFNTKRGGSKMGNLSEELMAELNCETAFTIPIFGGIHKEKSRQRRLSCKMYKCWKIIFHFRLGKH